MSAFEKDVFYLLREFKPTRVAKFTNSSTSIFFRNDTDLIRVEISPADTIDYMIHVGGQCETWSRFDGKGIRLPDDLVDSLEAFRRVPVIARCFQFGNIWYEMPIQQAVNEPLPPIVIPDFFASVCQYCDAIFMDRTAEFDCGCREEE